MGDVNRHFGPGMALPVPRTPHPLSRTPFPAPRRKAYRLTWLQASPAPAGWVSFLDLTKSNYWQQYFYSYPLLFRYSNNSLLLVGLNLLINTIVCLTCCLNSLILYVSPSFL